MAEKIVDVIKKLRGRKKRNFPQTFDLLINLRELDLKKPENKFSDEIMLPHGAGEDANVVVFSDTISNPNFQTIPSAEITNMGKNKRTAKKLARSVDFSLAEAKLMPLIGKTLGQMLAPRARMPKILSGNVEDAVQNLKKSIRIRVKDSPVINCKVGKETMNDEEIEANIKAVVKYLENKLPKGKANISKVMLKLTMSEPIEVNVFG